MERIKSPKSPLITKWLSIIYLSIFPAVSFSQVLNGNFEINGKPSLDNWILNCCFCESYQDAPGNGGSWCLKLESANTQGCIISVAHQIIPEFEHGDIWQVSVWARQDNDLTRTSIYLKIFHTTGGPTVLSVDTTSSNEWTQLTIVDTLFLDESDSVAIVLDPGSTGGPLPGRSYFDLVTAEKIGEIVVSVDDGFSQLHPKNFKLFQNFPNPFNPTTTIEYSIPEASFVVLKIYDILGGEVASLVKENKSSGKHSVKFNASNLPSGIYFYRIVSGNFTATKKLILLK